MLNACNKALINFSKDKLKQLRLALLNHLLIAIIDNQVIIYNWTYSTSLSLSLFLYRPFPLSLSPFLFLSLPPSLSLSPSLFLSLSLSLTGEEGVRTLASKKHAHTLSIHHSVSQSVSQSVSMRDYYINLLPKILQDLFSTQVCSLYIILG
jgi:hypothetical protein